VPFQVINLFHHAAGGASSESKSFEESLTLVGFLCSYFYRQFSALSVYDVLTGYP